MTKTSTKKCLVDTNVPKTANLAKDPESISDDMAHCVYECVCSVEEVVKKGGLVLDSDDEIYNEYRNQLSLSGQPGVGDKFMKWVNDHRWNENKIEMTHITKNGESYDEFPVHMDLTNFDISDRKFIAVANAHKDKPHILEATDSKWWGWKDALSECGIRVVFLCREWIEAKYSEKMKS